jgi:hypothetical protein
MISSAGVFFETLEAIGRVSKEVEKAHPRPSEEALENALQELDIYEKKAGLYSECKARVGKNQQRAMDRTKKDSC